MATRFEIEQRREKVELLLSYGWSQTTIAKTLGISRVTISKDVQWLRAKNRRAVTEVSKKQVIGDAMTRYSRLEQMAINEFSSAPAGEGVRAIFLQLAGKMREAQIKLLQTTGYLPKDGKADDDEFSLTGGVDPNELSLEELKAITHKTVMELTVDAKVPKEKLQKLLKTYDTNLSDDVIDVSAVEKEPDANSRRDERHSGEHVEIDAKTDTRGDSGTASRGTDDPIDT